MSINDESMAAEPKKLSVQYATIDADRAGQRLDNFLFSVLKGVPKSKVYKMIRKGEVRINKKRAKPESRLEEDDVVRLPPVRRSEASSVAVDRVLSHQVREAILYEQDGLIAVNKPSGLAVHGGSGVNLGLIEVLRGGSTSAEASTGESFLELVHRLDRDTSGLILVAKKRSVLRKWHEVFREGVVSKRYLALLHGALARNSYDVCVPLHKFVTASGERRVKVSESGQSARTQFKVLRRFPNATLVEARPHTGRTHQIRVHAQYLGHAIVGDTKYADDDSNASMRALGCKRLFLHAYELACASLDFDLMAPTDLDWDRAIESLASMSKKVKK